MLPVANLHLRELATATVEFFALRTPTNTPTHRPQDLDEERTLTPVHDPVGRLTRECASLRQRLDEADRRQSACTCQSSTSGLQPPSMRRDIDETRRELARTQTEVTRLQERCKLLEKTLYETREILKARDEELEKFRGSQAEPRDLEDGDDREDERPRSFEQENDSHPGSVSDETRALTKSTEVFMARTDSWSGAQVLQAIHDLNSEILQFSAAATELCTFGKNTTPSKLIVQATQDTASRLGPSVVRILSGRDHSQDPILVQLALQGCISTCVARALSVFCMGFPTKADAVLTQIYSHMYAAEPQPTSSRWRALTHRHIHTMYPYLSDYSANELAETMYRWSADILLVAGSQNYGKGSLASRDGLRTRFGEQVRRITKTACKLAQVTKEEIMSTCFEIIAVEHGDSFDSRRMFDSFGEYGTSRGAIITTTELGLRCKTRKNGAVGADESLTEIRMLMPPKVVLDSVLDLVDPK
ncbi:hypothetical protein GYMLUDRAFT_222731 [Collybiopsis luxurians FD-317 M1]|uniref:Uncharacterized protein n=1 Tax=Collybiopsis luxurians FD-317 M1 TaxID=944289 RepID=A0A0D0CU34_9AGAR|nr:hypothetical protein GYMLUDRAFT_222731 [Collybiopsis luxurians FD-317 M1]